MKWRGISSRALGITAAAMIVMGAAFFWAGAEFLQWRVEQGGVDTDRVASELTRIERPAPILTAIGLGFLLWWGLQSRRLPQAIGFATLSLVTFAAALFLGWFTITALPIIFVTLLIALVLFTMKVRRSPEPLGTWAKASVAFGWIVAILSLSVVAGFYLLISNLKNLRY